MRTSISERIYDSGSIVISDSVKVAQRLLFRNTRRNKYTLYGGKYMALTYLSKYCVNGQINSNFANLRIGKGQDGHKQ